MQIIGMLLFVINLLFGIWNIFSSIPAIVVIGAINLLVAALILTSLVKGE